MTVRSTPTENITSKTQQNTTPWQALNKVLPFQSTDHKQWWEKLGPVTAESLRLSKYGIDAQYKNLLLLWSTLIPALGPFHAQYGKDRTWIDCMANPDGPLDVSINYQRNHKCTFRMTIEPVGLHAGTDSDPVNELAAKQLLQNLNHIQPELDLTWLDHLDQIVIKNSDARRQWDIIGPIRCRSQNVVGLDFRDGLFTTKAYISPLLNSAVNGGNFMQIMFGNLRSLSKKMDLRLELDMMEEYLTGKNGVMGEKTYVSFDCKSPTESRIKIYSALWVENLEQVRDLWTLGGRLKGSLIEEGFVVVEKAWNALLPRRLPSKEETTSRITVNFNWELSPKDGSIAPKLYFLVDEDFDEHVSNAVTSILEGLGWHESAATHRQVEKDA